MSTVPFLCSGGNRRLIVATLEKMAVVRLGALADYEDVEDQRVRLAESGVRGESLDVVIKAARRQVSIGIEHYAILADGRRVVFDRPGFATGVSGVDDPWSFLTVEDIEDDVRTTLAPDDAAAGDQNWRHIARRLADLDVETSMDELMRVPFDLELSGRLQARLSADRHQRP